MLKRRDLLTSIGVGTTFLAGCTGDGGEGSSPDATNTQTSTQTSTDTPTETEEKSIELRVSAGEYWDSAPAMDIDATWEGVKGTEENVFSFRSDWEGVAELPSYTTYVEAEATAEGDRFDSGSIRLELVVSGEVVASDESGSSLSEPSVSVEGRTD